MISFRYHVVTLVAVFMALGVGVLFGATFISQNIVDGLEASQRRLGDRNESLRGRVVELENVNEGWQTFAASARDPLVRGALQDVPVVMVSFDSTQGELLDGVRSTLTLAGVRMDGHLTLTDGLDLESAEDRNLLAAALDSTSTSPDALSEELVAQLSSAAVGRNAEFLTRLLESGLVAAPIALIARSEGETAPAVVVVGGEASPGMSERVVVPLVRLFDAEQVVAAVVEGGTDVPLLESIRNEAGLRVVTVDSVERSFGQSALAVGLKAALAGQFGHYGRADGASPALPPA